jgi:single-strand DNA-binding protein
MNSLTVAGNLVADPEIRHTNSGIAQASFRIGVNRRYQSGGEWKQETTFLSCVCWSDLAESVGENLQKGQRVVVHGRVTQREFEARDGSKKSVVEIAVEELGVSLKASRKADATARVAPAPSQQEEDFF